VPEFRLCSLNLCLITRRVEYKQKLTFFPLLTLPNGDLHDPSRGVGTYFDLGGGTNAGRSMNLRYEISSHCLLSANSCFVSATCQGEKCDEQYAD